MGGGERAAAEVDVGVNAPLAELRDDEDHDGNDGYRDQDDDHLAQVSHDRSDDGDDLRDDDPEDPKDQVREYVPAWGQPLGARYQERRSP